MRKRTIDLESAGDIRKRIYTALRRIKRSPRDLAKYRSDCACGLCQAVRVALYGVEDTRRPELEPTRTTTAATVGNRYSLDMLERIPVPLTVPYTTTYQQ